jgi:plastocyanin
LPPYRDARNVSLKEFLMTHGHPRRALPAAALLTVLIIAGCSGSPTTTRTSSTPGGRSQNSPTASAGEPTASSATSSSRPTLPAAGSITIQNFTYSVSGPAAPGSTVNVTNKDDTAHTVTADSANAFDVTIQPGKTAKFTAPKQPGTYKFHCTFHANMHGTLSVSG